MLLDAQIFVFDLEVAKGEGVSLRILDFKYPKKTHLEFTQRLLKFILIRGSDPCVQIRVGFPSRSSLLWIMSFGYVLL